jgi:hypothetical protein
MSYKQVPRTQVVGIHKAPQELTYAQQPQTDVETIIQRTSASQYLVLDSRNRVFSSSNKQVINQPWNNFRLQKGQSLMESFATRLTISEIRFPWFIPNINSLNNQLWYISGTEVYDIQIDVGFLTPAQIVEQINQQFIDLAVPNPPVLSYSNYQYQFTLNVANVDEQYFSFFNPDNFNTSTDIEVYQTQYATTPSLMSLLGFTFDQSWVLNPVDGIIRGNITESLYTTYVDIVSDKLNQYTTNLDGSSDSTSNRLLLRLYLADECSFPATYAVDGVNALYQPFLIHRQFKNPKQVMWNKESVVDWLDISVRDQYGFLVPLPQILNGTDFTDGAYPDFQITLLATEN